MRVGVVCEGIHDFPALSAFVKELAAKEGVAISCHPLQPSADASARSGDGGWTKVVAWCLANAGRNLDTYLAAPLFEGETVFDLIVIHLDGDIAHECAARYNQPLGENVDVDERVKFLSNMIHGWVDADEERKKKIYTAIPTQKTETWMLAAVSNDDTLEWEVVESKSLFLQATGFVEGETRKALHYESMAGRIVGRVDLVRERCSSFSMFADQFS